MTSLYRTVLVAVLLIVMIGVGSGCARRPSTSVSTKAQSSPHPPVALGPNQERLILNGLAVTLTATSTLSAEDRRLMQLSAGIKAKSGYRPLIIEIEVLNTTDSTITIGSQSWPVLLDAKGDRVGEPISYGGEISSRGGPYWGHGGPPPGRPRHSDFSPGGTLMVRMPLQVPKGSEGLTVTWTLDPTRVAMFALAD